MLNAILDLKNKYILHPKSINFLTLNFAIQKKITSKLNNVPNMRA